MLTPKAASSPNLQSRDPRKPGDRRTQKTVCTRMGPQIDIRDHRMKWSNYSQNEHPDRFPTLNLQKPKPSSSWRNTV